MEGVPTCVESDVKVNGNGNTTKAYRLIGLFLGGFLVLFVCLFVLEAHRRRSIAILSSEIPG